MLNISMVNNLSQLVSNYPVSSFVVGCLGIYAGIYAVHWIATKLHYTKQHYKKASDLEIEKGPITHGQGEYVVFRGDKKPVNEPTFEKAYRIFVENAPEEIVKRSNSPEIEYANRYQSIKNKIQEIDSSLELAFIPRTLYELIYIVNCIKEDLKYKNTCDVVNPSLFGYFKNDEIVKFIEKTKKERKCWHALPFKNIKPDNKLCGGDPNIVYREDIIDIAHRLNNKIVSKLSPQPEGFTYDDLDKHADKAIEYLKNYFKKTDQGEILKTPSDISQKTHSDITYIQRNHDNGPTAYFASLKLFHTGDTGANSMGISKNFQVKAIKSALRADCSKKAQTAINLFRAAKIENDHVYVTNDWVKSLSFGIGLFSGCVWDPGACCFRYLHKNRTGYIISITLDELKSKCNIFYIPPTNSIAQLLGERESFHARTMAWKGADLKTIDMGNVCAPGGHVREHLESQIPENELEHIFNNHKKKAILLS